MRRIHGYVGGHPAEKEEQKIAPCAGNDSGGVGLVLLRTEHGLGDAGLKLLQTL